MPLILISAFPSVKVSPVISDAFVMVSLILLVLDTFAPVASASTLRVDTPDGALAVAFTSNAVSFDELAFLTQSTVLIEP